MILVTGAGGTVGRALIDELHGSDIRPRLAYHSEEKAARARSLGHDAVHVEYGEPETLRPALEGVDAVFLLGAGGTPQIEHEGNVIRAAVTAGVKKIVKVSVWDAAAEAYSFARIHRSIERTLESSGLVWTHLRPNGFMQNFLHYMGPLRATGVFFLPAGDAAISHVDVRDIARVAAAALTRPGHEGKAYELSGPRAFTYHEAAEVLSRAFGKAVRYIAVDDGAARSGMLAAGMPAAYAEHLLDLHRHYRSGGGASVSGAVERVTGRAPVDFETFVGEHLSLFGG